MDLFLYTPVSLEKLVAVPPGIRENLLIKSDCKKTASKGAKASHKNCAQC